MRSSQVTIKDIAKRLGISPSTVSRALKDHPDISAKTKKLVNDLAKTLDYKPNAIALSLRSSKSNIIGLVIPEIVHHFFSSVISGIEEVANDAGYHVMIVQSNESYEKELQGAQALLSSRVDGILASISKTTRAYEHLTNLRQNGIPVVLFDRTIEELGMDSVLVDDYGGAYQATEHLIKIGRKRIAHLGASQHLLIGKKRLQGYLDAHKEFGLTVDERVILKCDTHAEALESTKILLNMEERPDGIFAVNDSTAVGALITVKRAGLKIPDDIAIVGFGDGPIATITDPTLTTVEQPGFRMGKKASQLLLDRIANDDSGEAITEVLDTRLVVRQSTVKSETPI